MHNHPRAALAIITLMVAAAACSSSSADDAAPPPVSETVHSSDSADVESSTVVTGAPTITSSDGPQPIEVAVQGRTLSGRCSGSTGSGAPTVILEPGLGNTPSQLSPIAQLVSNDVRVCSYDRAGLGASDRAEGERTLSDLVDDLHAFVTQGGLTPPFVLVGQSMGANIVFRYAQTHPDTVTGFVAMNPVPPYRSWIEQAATVETPEELQSIEIEFFEGANDEGIDLRDTDLMVDEPMPDDLRYVVMYAEDCPGDFCDRIRPVLAAATEAIAHLGADGTFLEVPGAGHEIYLTDADVVGDQVLQLIQR